MEDGLVKVVAPNDETPAAKAGVMANDIIHQARRQQVYGLTLDRRIQDARPGEWRRKSPVETCQLRLPIGASQQIAQREIISALQNAMDARRQRLLLSQSRGYGHKMVLYIYKLFVR